MTEWMRRARLHAFVRTGFPWTLLLAASSGCAMEVDDVGGARLGLDGDWPEPAQCDEALPGLADRCSATYLGEGTWRLALRESATAPTLWQRDVKLEDDYQVDCITACMGVAPFAYLREQTGSWPGDGPAVAEETAGLLVPGDAP